MLALLASAANAHDDPVAHIDFRELCPENTVDCSAEFKQAVEDVNLEYEEGDKKGELIYDYIYFKDGQYNIKTFERLARGARLRQVAIKGEKWNGPVIKTDKLDFSQILNASLSHIRIEGPEYKGDDEEKHIPNELVRFGNNSVDSMDSLVIDHTIFRNSGEDLVNIVGVDNVKITTSHFENAGYEDTRVNSNDPKDLRPNGNAITMFNIDDANIQNVYFTKIRRVGIMAATDVHNLVVKSSTFNLKSPDNPTKLYGYQGGACFYQTDEANTNITFENNECNDFKVNGVRLKGSSMKVVDNHFNHKRGEECDISNYTPLQYNPGIKAHIAGPASYITGNCIHQASDGILLQPNSFRSINGLSVTDNTIVNSGSAIVNAGTGIKVAPYSAGGTYCGLDISNNYFINSGVSPVLVEDDGDSCFNNIEQPVFPL